MKSFMSSVDVRVIARELDSMLSGSRFDKAYSVADGMVRLRFHSSGTGMRDLVVAPGFLCTSGFKYTVMEKHSGFAMSLRKHLGGLFLRSLKQHEFDRIVELRFEGRELTFTLVIELFSTGNMILCDEKGVIVSLLERQKWKDRTLLPGVAYSYPPESVNPAAMDVEKFKTVLRHSKKSVAATIASMGLGGFYAEEICLNAGVEKTIPAGSLGEQQAEELFKSLRSLVDKADAGVIEASIVLDAQGDYVDVLPFKSSSYSRNQTVTFKSFNEAVDEYYGRLKARQFESQTDGEFNKNMAKLNLMKEKQAEALARLRKEAEDFRKAGDLIYQHLDLVDRLICQVAKARKQGFSDLEITSRIYDGRVKGIVESKIFKRVSGNKMTLEFDESRA